MEELIIQNEWWERKEISSEKAKPYRRKVFKKVKNLFLNYRQMLILTGLRRVGKTTLIYQLIEDLLKRGVNPEHILYFSFDKKTEEPVEILKLYQKITKVNWKREKIYLFLDEIQKLEDWSSKIKLLYDNLPNAKICISGSASLMLEEPAIRDLAGRYFKIEIKPLTLQEYAELYYEKPVDNFELYHSELKAIFDDYIRKPFPEIVRVNDWERVYEYINSIVIEKILGSDIPTVFKKVNIHLLKTLSEIFFKRPGMILNIDELSRKLHVHKLTVKEHIHYLEFGKLIKIVKNFRPSIMAESRKLPKVYPFHPSFSFARFAEVEKGKIFENLVMHALDLNNYFRNGRYEIDFLKRNKELVPIEVKAKRDVELKELKNLVRFAKQFRVSNALVVCEDAERVMNIDELTLQVIPLIKLLFK